MNDPLLNPPELKRAIRLADKTQRWSEDELTYIASTMLFRIADMLNMTIREAGEKLILLMEESWVSEGEDISIPPRAGGADA